MQVKQLAEWAGTTVRTVRHYHHLGLLEVPPTVRGRRDYTIAHLARLLRIRWLADSGVPLAQISEILSAEDEGTLRETVRRDLEQVRQAIISEQEKLRRQAERLDDVFERLDDGEPLSPMPTVLSEFYDDLTNRIIASGNSPGTIKVERQIMLVMAAHGMIPPSVGPFLAALDEDDLDLCARQFADFSELVHLNGPEGLGAAHELAGRSWSLMLKHRQPLLRMLDDMPDGAVGRTMWMLVRMLTVSGYPHPLQVEFANHLLALMDQDPDFSVSIRRWAGEEPRL